MRRWQVGSTVLMGALLALTAPAVHADPVASATSATWEQTHLTLDALAKSVPLGVENATISARITAAGVTVPATITYASSETPDTSTPQTLMLVIDASGSMTGTRQAATNRAVDQFLASAPANAPIGVVGFSARATLLAEPTTDRDRVRTLVRNLRPSGDTAIYDAVTLGIRVLGDQRPCTLLVLTDGEDTASRKSLRDARQSLAASPCNTSFVGLQTNASASALLEQLATAGHGRAFKATDAEGISGVFLQSFTTTNASISMVADFPTDFDQRNRTISVDLVINDFHIGFTTRATPVPEAGRSSLVSTTLLVLAGLLFASIFLLAWLLTEGTDRARRRRVDSLIAAYALQRVESAETKKDDTVMETLEDLVRPLLARSQRGAKLAVKIDGAGLEMTPEQWVLIRLGLATGLGLFLGLASNSLAAALLVGAPAGFAVPQIWLSRRRKSRGKRFEEGLPDALMLMASSLRSGFSLDQAIVAAADQSENEVSTELRRAVQEIRIGSPLDASLDRIADRMDSIDFRWVVTALRIQRKSGGNLSELLITASHTVRQRAQLGREVAALTAEGRLSAYVLIGLPFGLFAFLMVTQPDYLAPLYTTPTGLMVSAVGIVMLTVGWLIMEKLVEVEV